MSFGAKNQEHASVQYLVQGCVKKGRGVTFVHLVFARQSVKGRSKGRQRQDAKGSLAGGQNASLSLWIFFLSFSWRRAASFPPPLARAN